MKRRDTNTRREKRNHKEGRRRNGEKTRHRSGKKAKREGRKGRGLTNRGTASALQVRNRDRKGCSGKVKSCPGTPKRTSVLAMMPLREMKKNDTSKGGVTDHETYVRETEKEMKGTSSKRLMDP